MTDELPPDIRALLADSRAQLGPDGAAIARLRMRVAAGVGKGVVGATFVKVVLLGVAVASTGAIAYALRRAPASTAPVIDVAGSASSADEAPRVHAVEHEASAPTAPDDTATRVARTDPKRTIIVEPIVPAPAAAQATPPAQATPVAHVALAREIQLVDQATRALHRGDFASAAAIVHTYDLETAGTGQLAEDAAAIGIEAACGQHADVTTQLAHFTQRWPSSAQHARITAACTPGATR